MEEIFETRGFQAHTGRTNCLSFGRKSGMVFVTGGDDQVIKLWNVNKQTPIMTLSGHTSGVECAAFDPNEELVISGSTGSSLKLFNLEKQQVLRTYRGHRARCTATSFHPIGDYFASSSQDCCVKMWDVRRSSSIQTYKGHTETIDVLSFSPDGKWLLSGGGDGVVNVWDLTMGTCLHRFELQGAITAIDFHPNEFMLCIATADKTISFYNTEQFTEISTIQTSSVPRKIVFHPNGQNVIAAFNDSVQLLEWEPGAVVDECEVNLPSLADFAVVRNHLRAASVDGTACTIYSTNLDSLFANDFKSEELEMTINLISGLNKNAKTRQTPAKELAPEAADAENESEKKATEEPETPNVPLKVPHMKDKSTWSSEQPRTPLRSAGARGQQAQQQAPQTHPAMPMGEQPGFQTATQQAKREETSNNTMDVETEPAPLRQQSQQGQNSTQPQSTEQQLDESDDDAFLYLLTEDEALATIEDEHLTIDNVLKKRNDYINRVHQVWVTAGVHEGIEVLKEINDPSTSIAVLAVLRDSDYTLETTIELLPLLTSIVSVSHCEEHALAVLRTVSLLIDKFGSMIQNAVSTEMVVESRRDVHSEQCRKAYDGFRQFRIRLNGLARRGVTVGNKAKEIIAKMHTILHL